MLAEDFLGGFWICVVDSPLTGYLFLLEVVGLPLRGPFFVDAATAAAAAAAAVVVAVLVVSLGCFGRTKALVCFSRYRSLHSAEISGKSKLRLFSRSVRMSNIPSSFPSSFFFSSVPADDLPGLLVVATPDDEVKEADGSG